MPGPASLRDEGVRFYRTPDCPVGMASLGTSGGGTTLLLSTRLLPNDGCLLQLRLWVAAVAVRVTACGVGLGPLLRLGVGGRGAVDAVCVLRGMQSYGVVLVTAPAKMRFCLCSFMRSDRIYR